MLSGQNVRKSWQKTLKKTKMNNVTKYSIKPDHIMMPLKLLLGKSDARTIPMISQLPTNTS